MILNPMVNTGKWSIVASVLMILVGLVAIIEPAVTGVLLAMLLAWVLIFSGIMHFVFAAQTHTRGGSMWWEILVGILYIGIGIYMRMHPGVALVTLTAALAAYLVIEAILEFVLAYQFRGIKGSGLLVFHGIISLILAALIFRTWPQNSAWVIGLLVGISMLCSGLTRLTLAMSINHAAKAVPS
jgi:uncharacterized membrane protein HdeD (DUF308 family)